MSKKQLHATGRRSMRAARFGFRLHVGGIARSFFYQPLAVLLAILLAPSLSWFETQSGFTSSSGPHAFQADAQVQTGGGCGPSRPNAIIQQNFCPGGVFYTRDLYQLESDAVSSYLAQHNLPASDAHLIYDVGRIDLRSAVRAYMLAGLLAIVEKPAAQRTQHEQALYNWLQTLVQQNEIADYTNAINEYNSWRGNPCGFRLDSDIASQYGLSYDPSFYCASPLNSLFQGPPVPAESYFLAYGLKNSYGAPAQTYPYFASIVGQTQLSVGAIFGIGMSAGAVVAGGTAGLIAGFSSSVFPLAFGSNVPELMATGAWVIDDATASALGVGESVGVFAGTAAIILVAVAIGVSAGMQAFSSQQTINDLNNLNSNLTQAKNNKPDLSSFASDSSGLGTNKLMQTFVAQTLPGAPSGAALPPHTPGTDPGFAIAAPGASAGSALASEQLTYQNWNGLNWTAQTSGGWFVQTCDSGARCATPYSFSADIQYVDWAGTKWTASRIGGNFVSTKGAPASTDQPCPADEATGVSPGTDFSACLSYVSSSLPLKDGDGNPVSASLSLKPAFTSPATLSFTTGRSATATITATGIPVPKISVNGGLPIQFSLTPGQGTASLNYLGAPQPGTYQIPVVADNGFGLTKETLTVNVITQLSITSPSTMTGLAATPVTFLVTTTGDLPMKLSIDPVFTSGTGFSFTDNGNGTATIQGTSAGNSTGIFCVNINNTPCGITATNASGSVTQQFGISLTTPPFANLVGSPNVTFSAGAPNSVLLVSQGAITPVYWIFNEFGRAPSWVSFHDNGDGTALLSGTPPAGIAGSFTFSLLPVARGTIPTLSAGFTINVQDVPGFLTSSIARFIAGSAGSFEIQSNGPPVTDNDATLPQGLTFTGGSPADISGTPAAGTGGIHALQLSASDERGTGSQQLTLEIDEAPSITSAQVANFHVGVESSFKVTTLGYPNVSNQPNPTAIPTSPDQGLGMHFDVTGLPADFTASNLNPEGFATGTLTIKGTPTEADLGAHGVRITATNGVGAPAQQLLVLNVEETASVPSSPTKCDGTYSGSYTGNLNLQPGQTCDFEGGSVSGNIDADGGGSLILHGTQVGGSVRVGSNRFGSGFDIQNVTIAGSVEVVSMIAASSQPDQVCGTHIEAPQGLNLVGNSISIQIGGSGCAANTIDGLTQATMNSGTVVLDGMQITGDLVVNDNKGAVQVFNNSISGRLDCSLNTSITGGNDTAAAKGGQCAAF